MALSLYVTFVKLGHYNFMYRSFYKKEKKKRVDVTNRRAVFNIIKEGNKREKK